MSNFSEEEKIVLFHTNKTDSIQKLTMLDKRTIDILNHLDITIVSDLCERVEIGSRIEGIPDAEMQKLRTIASFYQRQCA